MLLVFHMQLCLLSERSHWQLTICIYGCPKQHAHPLVVSVTIESNVCGSRQFLMFKAPPILTNSIYSITHEPKVHATVCIRVHQDMYMAGLLHYPQAKSQIKYIPRVQRYMSFCIRVGNNKDHSRREVKELLHVLVLLFS